MAKRNDDTPMSVTGLSNRDLQAANTESLTDEAWISCAVQATTIGELYDAARQAQAAGAWDQRDAAWCSAIRSALGAGDRAALALLRRELGAVPLSGPLGGAA